MYFGRMRKSQRVLRVMGSLTAATAEASTERGDLRLPLLAEGEDQHLLIDLGVLDQRFHRAATRRREHLIGRLGLPVELRQRRDLRRFLAMHLQPELALETLM